MLDERSKESLTIRGTYWRSAHLSVFLRDSAPTGRGISE
jgi:hypothetical protein